MNNQRQLLLGIFFIVALSILAFYTLFLTDIHIFSKPILMTVYFPNANGLREGDPVQFLGARIGRVKELSFETATEEKKRVRTLLSLDREVELLEGAQITIRESSFLGGRHVDIDPGAAGGPPFVGDENGAFFGTVYRNPIAMLGDIGALLNENRESINHFLSNLDTISTDIKNGKGLIGRLIEDQQLGEDAKVFVSNLGEASEKMKTGEGLLGALIYDPSLKQTFTSTLDRIDKIGADVESQKGVLGALINDSALRDKFSTGIDSFVSFGKKLDSGEGALGLLLSDPTTKEEVKTMVSNLKTSSDKIVNITTKLDSGEGTLGKLLSSNEGYDELKRTLGILNRSLEDYREAAPITAFTSVLFAAF